MRRAHPIEIPLWRRALLVLTAGLALAFGMTVSHDPLFEHDGLRGTVVDEAARHPEAPPHFEGSKSAFRGPCESCLLQLQTASQLVPPPAPLPEPVRSGIVTFFETVHVSSPSPHLGSARGPPASLSVL
ncbi:MAG TPA: hypothetical protein VH394_05165 [Thermoanaerobaculia bacterium]|jgi:hypothetical protein|nr:hypothetical protein [Thermoanaerobaculia bacterium]